MAEAGDPATAWGHVSNVTHKLRAMLGRLPKCPSALPMFSSDARPCHRWAAQRPSILQKTTGKTAFPAGTLALPRPQRLPPRMSYGLDF